MIRVTASGRAATITVAAIGVFVATGVVLPVVQHGRYSVGRQTMSELALGSWGWMQNVAFCVLGVGTVALAVAVRRAVPARVAPVLLSVAGVLDFVSATFHAVLVGHPQTASSAVHMAAGIGTFVLTYIAMFSLVRPLRGNVRLRWFAAPTGWWGVGSVLIFIASAPPVVGQDHFGIGQRVMAASFMSWMLVTALVLVADSRRRRPPAAAAGGRTPGMAMLPGRSQSK